MRQISRDDIQLEALKRTPKPLLVYTMWGVKETWIAKYRITGPLKAGKAKGLCDYISDTGNQAFKEYTDLPAEEARYQAMSRADCHLYHLTYNEAILKLCLMEPRPAIIFGADDHTEAIEPLNPQFVGLGTRGVDGVPLVPGQRVNIKDDQGNPLPLWVDKETWEHGVLFDIERNLRDLDRLKAVAHEADGILVSTEKMAEVYRGYGAKNIYIYPNSIDFTLYPKVDLKEHDEVRILWTGGSSHIGDLYQIRDPLRNVLRKYPQAQFISFGQEFPVMNKWFGEFGERYRFIPWVDPDAYTFYLSCIGHDINLCPIRPTEFNSCKSAIKWYESAAISNPAATLAANWGPFQEIEPEHTGLLYDSPKEFERNLGRLIENATLRRKLAHNASDWVHEHRDITKNVGPLIDWMRATSQAVRDNYTGTLTIEESVGAFCDERNRNLETKPLIEVVK